MSARGVLITRPEPALWETAAAVAARGWQPVPAPALQLSPQPLRAAPAQAVLLTSRAAARALPTLPAGLPVLAVGEGTAAEMRARGHAPVWAAEGDAQALAELAAGRLDPAGGPLLLAVGRGYALDLAAALRARGFRVLRRVVYVARPAERLPEAAAAALAGGEVAQAMFFSPRSALVAMRLIVQAGCAGALKGVRAVAISQRVARCLAALPWAGVVVAARPDHAAMLEGLGCPP